jgi:hypothetical protein
MMQFYNLALKRGYWLKLGLTLGLLALGDLLFWQQELGVGNFGLYGVGLILALVIVRPAVLQSLSGKLTVLAGLLYASAIFIDTGFFSVVLFWTALTVAALLPFSSRLKDGWQWFWRLVIHGLMAAFMPLIDAARVRKITVRRGLTNKFSARAALSLFALPVLGGAAFLALFVQANPILEKIVGTWKLPALELELIFRAILWTIGGIMIWSLFRPMRHKGGLTKSTGAPESIELQLPSLASITLSLFVFNGLFLMQNGMDLAFLSGIVPLPDRMTLAQYAHRGAYPLIGTALAGLFVLVVLKPDGVAVTNRLARMLVIIWIAQNIVLVTSSMVRTWDYIDAYSLTQMRIAALVWMALVGVGLGLICWRLLKAKSGSWLINANLWAAGVVLTGFCFIDMGAMAARWNVTHAKEVGGRGAGLDLCHMRSLGAGALAPLMKLEQTSLPEPFLARVKATREHLQTYQNDVIAHRGWTWRRAHRLDEANALATTLPARDLGTGERDCDGRLISSIIQPTPTDASALPELTPSVTR